MDKNVTLWFWKEYKLIKTDKVEIEELMNQVYDSDFKFMYTKQTTHVLVHPLDYQKILESMHRMHMMFKEAKVKLDFGKIRGVKLNGVYLVETYFQEEGSVTCLSGKIE